MEGSALTPSRGRLTPLRATLLLLGAVLGGVVLSLILGSSAAHAADGDGNGSGSGESPLGSLTSVVSATVITTVDQSMPIVQYTERIAGDSVATTIPAAGPVVSPVVAAVDATVTAVRQLGVPAVHGLLLFTNGMAAPNQALAVAPTAPVIPSPAPQTARSVVSTSLNGFGLDGMSPGSILTSGTGAPAGALGVLLALVALVLMAARRRLDDDALPASPVFDTDTSPA
jgi:hypothetical protein